MKMVNNENLGNAEAWERAFQIGKDYTILDPISKKIKFTEKYNTFMENEKNFDDACDKVELESPHLCNKKDWNKYITHATTNYLYSFSPSLINEDREFVVLLSLFIVRVNGLYIKEKTTNKK